MKATMLVAALALVAPKVAQAQDVSAEVVIHQGPVAARVVVGPRYPVYHTERVIVVERGPRHSRGWQGHEYRRTTVWYDPRGNRYYDRYNARPGLREVVVYQCDGRYFRYDDDRRSRYDDRYSSRGEDGYSRDHD